MPMHPTHEEELIDLIEAHLRWETYHLHSQLHERRLRLELQAQLTALRTGYLRPSSTYHQLDGSDAIWQVQTTP